MKPKYIKLNKQFIGRQNELEKFSEIKKVKEASIVVLYGRRRIGKTELAEQAFRTRNIIKFEGIEGQSQLKQMKNVLQQLAEYTQNSLMTQIVPLNWTQIFKLINEHITKYEWTLYFEEVQWLADYKNEFISELKYVWDNYFRHKNKLIIILCGSSPSFIINQVLHSKALYNRAQYEIPLQEFSIIETKEFLKRLSLREVMDAYLCVGGIPEYLKWLSKGPSVFLSLCKNAFQKGSFFQHEYERIFTSSLARNPNYKKIIEFLSKKHFASRKDILNYLKLNSGGSLSKLLTDLEICGFIQKYTPFNLNEKSLLARYCVSDAYLQFYFSFIKPIQKEIANGDYDQDPVRALNTTAFNQYLGYAFERFCRKYHRLIAKILGFSSVQYKFGAFFSRSTISSNPGYQLDLVFDRADKVYTLCEIKYLKSKVSTNIISEFEQKLSLFLNPRKQSIQKVLITSLGAEAGLINQGYFDRIISLEDIFDLRYW